MITVVRIREHPDAEYIGRGSPLGNPFVIGKDGNRAEVCAKYEEWLRHRVNLWDSAQGRELRRLYDLYRNREELKLGCFCAPLQCHGDLIKQWLEDTPDGTS